MQVRDFLSEGIPVTMHVAIEATDGFVLASDLKNRLGNQRPGDVVGTVYHSKVAHSEKHRLLAAMMGSTIDPDAEPQNDLVRYLEERSATNREEISHWVHSYAKLGDQFSLLILNPSAANDRMWKIITDENGVRTSSSYKWQLVHGNDNSASILWLKLFRCEGQRPLSECIRIAALTLLTAGEIDESGVRGLELWRYDSKWSQLPDAEINSLTARYAEFRAYIQSFISI